MSRNNQKIPAGWSVKKLGELANHVKYGIVDGPFGSNLKTEHYRDSGIPVIQSGFVTSQKFYAEKYLYVDNELFQKEKRSATHGNDIIMAKIGAHAGTAAILPKNHPESILAGNCLKITINPTQASNRFILLTLHTKYNKDAFIDIKSTTAQPAISMENLKKLKVLLPPLPEQEKIAEILGTWDVAIEKLSGLIEQKKLLKKGLMQRLLTGKTRLPGFSQPWKEVKLGEICKLETTTSKSAFIDENGKYYIIDMGAVSMEGTLISSKRTNTCEDLLKINDIVMPKDDIGGGNIIGKTAIIKQENTYILSDHVFKLNIHDSDSNFISYLVNSYGYNKYMRRMSCGSAILGLSKKDVEKCLLNIPSDISEQQAIADVLSTADDEINLLNQKLEAIKEQKKGLMQQLLTGQIRVKVN